MSSTLVTLIVAAAARAGAPIVKSLLRDKVGGVAGEIGESVIDAVAKKAGVAPAQIEQLPDRDLEKAVQAVEREAPTLFADYLAAQKETNKLFLAEIKASEGSKLAWLWRPLGMYLMLLCIAMYVFGFPILSAIATAIAGVAVKIEPGVDFATFTTVFVTFTGLYMGGHTAKAMFKK